MKKRIKRLYNNNVVLCKDDDNSEVIYIGKGLAYGMSKGDWIDPKKAEKKFKLQKETNNKFQELIQDIPLDIVILSDDIITFIKDECDKSVDDSIYVTLTDHIMNMIERINMGIDFDGTLLINVKSLYKEEYKVALQVVDKLRERLNLKIDTSEANFITLHIVNAQLHSNMMEMYEITTMLEGILAIVDNDFDMKKEDNHAYDTFVTHCRYFAQRVINNEILEKNSAMYEPIFKVMQGLYGKQYECVNKIADYIQKNHEFVVDDDEKMYLLLHLVKLTVG